MGEREYWSGARHVGGARCAPPTPTTSTASAACRHSAGAPPAARGADLRRGHLERHQHFVPVHWRDLGGLVLRSALDLALVHIAPPSSESPSGSALGIAQSP